MKELRYMLILLIPLLAACGNKGNMARLDEADRLLDQYPDSALAIVRRSVDAIVYC